MKEGKFLEMLVECLQRLLTSDGISVTCNEKFYSKGRQVGEVDVVLRGKLGSANMVVGIECRDRKNPQDRTWIRNLIGKREDLAKFGFNHWVAVSSSGFTSTAEELAKEANIEILVPGTVEPVDADKPGPHDFMHFVMRHPMWRPHRVSASIGHDLDEVLDRIEEQIEKTSWDSVQIQTSDARTVSLRDLLKPAVDAYGQDDEAEEELDFEKAHVFKFNDLEGVIDETHFKIAELNVEVVFYQETIQPKFRIMAFVVPSTHHVLGLIGINEYEISGDTKYLMVGVKPDDVCTQVMVFRDSAGNPIANQKVKLELPVNFIARPRRVDSHK